MKNPRGSGFRLHCWAGAAVVLLTILVGTPRDSDARRYEQEPGPTPEGDPTADDQPSPTPKNYSAPMPELRDGRMGGRGAWSNGRLLWLSYVRTWIRITVR